MISTLQQNILGILASGTECSLLVTLLEVGLPMPFIRQSSTQPDTISVTGFGAFLLLLESSSAAAKKTNKNHFKRLSG